VEGRLNVRVIVGGLGIMLCVAGCGLGGGGGGDEEPGEVGFRGGNLEPPENLTVCIDVSGEWSVDESTVVTCDGEPDTDHDTFTMQVEQSACKVRVTMPGGTLRGSVDGHTITLRGDLSYRRAISTTEVVLIVSEDGDGFAGSSTFTWKHGGSSCPGTSELMGERTESDARCVDVVGKWTITETVGPNDCGDPTGPLPEYEVTMEQRGSIVYVWSPWDISNGAIKGDTVTWNTSFYEDGGDTEAAVSITVAGDSLSGSATWTWSDGETTCSGVNTLSGVRTGGAGGNAGTISLFVDTYLGGTLSVENVRGDVISLDVPPGALPSSMVVSLEALADSADGPVSDSAFPGVDIKPDGLLLNIPATLTVTFAAPLQNPAATTLYWVHSPELAVPISERNLAGNTLSGKIHHFSPYGGGSPSTEEILNMAELLAELIRKGLFEDEYGWLDTYDFVNDLLELSRLCEVLGQMELSDQHLNSAKGCLEQSAYAFLNRPIPKAPCGQYHGCLAKFTQLVETLLDDPVLVPALRARLAEIDDRCLDDVIGKYEGKWKEYHRGCMDPEDDDFYSSYGWVEIGMQSVRDCRGNCSAGFSLGTFSGSLQPLGYLYGKPAYSSRGTASYHSDESYWDDMGNYHTLIVRGKASYVVTIAGGILGAKWTFRDISGDSCRGEGSGKFKK